jgi:hypothetical protein
MTWILHTPKNHKAARESALEYFMIFHFSVLRVPRGLELRVLDIHLRRFR